jgi:hypothetical protein
MGFFDAIKSVFGDGERDDDSDASSAEETDSESERERADAGAPAESADETTGNAADDGGSGRTDEPTAGDSEDAVLRDEVTPSDDDSAGGPGDEIVGEASAADDISEWTFDEAGDEDEAETRDDATDEQARETGDADADSDDTDADSDDADADSDDTDSESDDAEDEPVSWEETGFEQLTTELVDEDEEADESGEEGDPADLITEAEPDRADGDEREGDSADAAVDSAERGAGSSGEEPTDEGDDEMAAAVSAADESADRLDDVGSADAGATPEYSDGPDDREPDLPLAEGVADDGADAEDEGSVDVPEDSPRADFVSEAVDLAEFWAEYDLDFTVGSLARLDELIDDQWDPERFAGAEFGGEGYDSEVFTEQVRAIGSYLGEVFVRTHGGEWVRQDGVGWTVDVQAGPSVDAAGATVTVFHIAQSALRGEASVAARHDGVVEQLDLDERVGVEDPTATLQQAGGHSQPRSADEDVVERFRAGAEDLADRWPDYDLDFSTASLERLEELLADELEDGRFDDVELGDETDGDSLLLTAHAVGVGGYLAEVLRREHDADWVTDGRLIVVVEAGEQRHEIDPIEAAVDAIRGERSLPDLVPERD